MKKILLIISILLLSGCSSGMQSILATKLYKKANPCAPGNQDQISFAHSDETCEDLKRICRDLYNGRYTKYYDTSNTDRKPNCQCIH